MPLTHTMRSYSPFSYFISFSDFFCQSATGSGVASTSGVGVILHPWILLSNQSLAGKTEYCLWHRLLCSDICSHKIYELFLEERINWSQLVSCFYCECSCIVLTICVIRLNVIMIPLIDGCLVGIIFFRWGADSVIFVAYWHHSLLNWEIVDFSFSCFGYFYCLFVVFVVKIPVKWQSILNKYICSRWEREIGFASCFCTVTFRSFRGCCCLRHTICFFYRFNQFPWRNFYCRSLLD